MFLAGIPVRDDLVLELARLVDDDTLIRALDDPPAGLEELRTTLLQEHAWRLQEGL